MHDWTDGALDREKSPVSATQLQTSHVNSPDIGEDPETGLF